MTLLEELQVGRPGLCRGAEHPPNPGKTPPDPVGISAERRRLGRGRCFVPGKAAGVRFNIAGRGT